MTKEWNSFVTTCWETILMQTPFTPPVWSECTASSLWPLHACQFSNVQFDALFYSADHKIFVLVHALKNTEKFTIRRFKKSATFKKEDNILKN
jgi:hypothetical protein